MKKKTAWLVVISDTNGGHHEDYLVTAEKHSSAVERALKLLSGPHKWISVPYVKTVKCLGDIYIF